MKCIVTGSNGFIGSNLVTALERQGDLVYRFTRDNWDLTKCDFNRLKDYIHAIDPDYIFHYAGNPLVKESSHLCTLDNTLATHRLLDACTPNVKFVFASSATVYGVHNNPRYYYHQPNPSSIYGKNKLFCEELITKYKEENKIGSYLNIRYVAHVGGGHGLISAILEKLKSDNPKLELLNNSRKPYLHIDDSVKATLYAVENLEGVVNISPGDNISVKEVAETIMDELGIYKPITFRGHSWNGDDDYVDVKSCISGIRSSKQAIIDYVRSHK